MSFEYQLQRKKIKRIILRILEDGKLQVSAPFFVSRDEIETFLSLQASWIAKARQKIATQKKKKSPFQSHYTSGDSFSIFGKEITLQLRNSKETSIYLGNHFLYVFYLQEEKEKIDDIIRCYLCSLLKETLEFYLNIYSSRLELFPDKFQIKHMKSAWGIYHSRGNDISFNSLLISQDKEFIEYVVVHELCHIRYLNHQKEFWNLVAGQIPNYREIRKSSR